MRGSFSEAVQAKLEVHPQDVGHTPDWCVLCALTTLLRTDESTSIYYVMTSPSACIYYDS